MDMYIYPGLADFKIKTKKKLFLRPGSDGKVVSDVPSAQTKAKDVAVKRLPVCPPKKTKEP
jgi:hypothetical protein